MGFDTIEINLVFVVDSSQGTLERISMTKFSSCHTFGRRKKIKIFGASFYHSFQLVYTRNEKYSSLESSELPKKLSALH